MKTLLFVMLAATMTVSCVSKQKQDQATEAAAAQAKAVTIDSVNTANQQEKTIDSLKTVVDEKEQVKQAAEDKPVVQTQTPATTETNKKGWNSTTKGAVIGAGAGGITGAMVAKHKGAGAVVGGLLGAGVGAGTGAVIDGSKKKKDPK